MQLPQVIVFEPESRLATQLRELVAARRWVLQEPRQRAVFWQQMRRLVPTVCVINAESAEDDALAIGQKASQECPHAALVIIGGPDNADALAGLAWDVGADFALFPPLSRDLLPSVVAALMQRQIKKQSPAETSAGLGSFENESG
jgi:hypothetical protein